MKTEYQMMKTLCQEAARLSPEHTAATANGIIGQACEDAYEDLDCMEKGIIRRQKQYLMDFVDRIGEQGALELLAAVSEYVGKE